MEDALMKSLWSAKREDLNTDNGNFLRIAWRDATEDVQIVTPQPISSEICQNRWRKLKETWRLWTIHKNQIKSWGWDSERHTFYTTEEAMDEYFEKHPNLKMFREQGPRNRDILAEILDGEQAPGYYASGINSISQAEARAAAKKARASRRAPASTSVPASHPRPAPPPAPAPNHETSTRPTPASNTEPAAPAASSV
jgi:hypothetical protein